jgi:hypothetical protein
VKGPHALERRERTRVEAAPAPVRVQVPAALERPRPQVLATGGVRLGELELSPTEAAELLIALERHRHPKAWRDLEAWIDHWFRLAVPVRVQEARARGTTGPRVELGGLVVRTSPGQAMVRLAPFQVAHLVARRARPWWSGPVADYSPGPLGTGPGSPDARPWFGVRRVRVAAELLAELPIDP